MTRLCSWSLYNNLADFIRRHFPEIKVSSDIEKNHTVKLLVNSRTFRETHDAISKLKSFINLLDDSDRQKLSDAGIKNAQIYQVGTDIDVQQFYKSIFNYSSMLYSQEDIEKIKTEFGISIDSE